MNPASWGPEPYRPRMSEQNFHDRMLGLATIVFLALVVAIAAAVITVSKNTTERILDGSEILDVLPSTFRQS